MFFPNKVQVPQNRREDSDSSNISLTFAGGGLDILYFCIKLMFCIFI